MAAAGEGGSAAMCAGTAGRAAPSAAGNSRLLRPVLAARGWCGEAQRSRSSIEAPQLLVVEGSRQLFSVQSRDDLLLLSPLNSFKENGNKTGRILKLK